MCISNVYLNFFIIVRSRKEVIIFENCWFGCLVVLNLAINKIVSKLNYLPFPERTWLSKNTPQCFLVACEFNSKKY